MSAGLAVCFLYPWSIMSTRLVVSVWYGVWFSMSARLVLCVVGCLSLSVFLSHVGLCERGGRRNSIGIIFVFLRENIFKGKAGQGNWT